MTPGNLAASRTILAAMQVDTFVARLLTSATCPAAMLEHPVVQETQLMALEGYLQTFSLTPSLDEASRDLCHAFSAQALAALSAFARTEAGVALLALVPQLRLDIKYGESLGPERFTALCEDDQQALLACLRQIDAQLPEALARQPGQVMRQAWTRPFTPEVIGDMAAFLRRPEGRIFVDYLQRGCWLGVPSAVVLQRDTWVKSIVSDMVSLLQQHGVPVPAPLGDLPIYFPSEGKIEELAS